MTDTAARPTKAVWRVLLLAALAALAALLLPAGPASAATAPAAEKGVGAIHLQTILTVGVHEAIRAGQHPVRGPSQSYLVSGHCVAAEGATSEVGGVLGGLAKGRSPNVWTVSSEDELNAVYDELTAGGQPAEWSGYKGTVIERSDGTQIGIRGTSSSGGATIDIRLPDGTMQKIHIQ